jgi:hypothetical protein
MSTEQNNITNNEVDVEKNYNPFLQNVNEKPYTSLSVGVSQEQMINAIPEPAFTPQSIDSGENPYANLGGDSPSGGGGGDRKSSPINPAMNDIPDADKSLGAEHLTNLILDGYEQLHVFGNQMLQFPERKIRKLVSEGEIDLGIPIPYEMDKTITAGEFIQEFNEQNKDTLVVTKEFKKEVKPVLKRVLEKRGAGITDEQFLVYAFGKDMVVKGVIIAQMRGTMNDMIQVIKEQTIAFREGGGYPSNPTTPTPQAPTPQPTYQAPTQTYQEPDHSAPDFNFQDNEVVVNSTVQQHSVPTTGKARVIAQIEKEKKWKRDSQGAKSNSSYEQAMNSRKRGDGKRGRSKKNESIPLDEEQIAEAIILNETINQPKKEKDPYADLD